MSRLFVTHVAAHASFWHSRVAIAMLLPLVLLSGCASEIDQAQVRGTVTLDGQPLVTGTVLAVNRDGKSASGAINSSGGFMLSRRGESDVLPGEYQVTVIAYEGGGLADADPEAPPRKLSVPRRYTDPSRSTLSFTINAGESKEVLLKLTSQSL